MGVSTLKGFIGKSALMAVAVGNTPSKATRVAGEAAAVIIRGVSPSRLRNVGKGGADLKVRVQVTGAGTNALGRVYGSGPWQIIEYDTKPHPIPRLKGSRGKKFGPGFGGAVRLPDGGIRRQVFHPGTKGQLPFHIGATIARPVIPKVYQIAIEAELAAVFF